MTAWNLAAPAERTIAGEHIFPNREPNVEIGEAWSDELSETQENILH